MRSFFTVLAAIVLSSTVFAQKAPVVAPPNDAQTQLFRGLLHFNKLSPVTKAAAEGRNFDVRDLVVIVFGPPRGDLAPLCRKVLSNGGALLIATDAEIDLSLYFPSACNVGVSGMPVYFPTSDPAAVVRPKQPGDLDDDFTTSGFVEPVQPGLLDRGGALLGEGSEYELFGPYARVQTQMGSTLSIQRRPKELARDVAVFPRAAVQYPDGQRAVRVNAKFPFAAAGAGSDKNPYRCMLMADWDLLSNAGIYTSGSRDNPSDNLKFANGLVQWLQGPQVRSKCLFIEAGTVSTKFDEFEFSSIPLGQPEMPAQELPDVDPFAPEFQAKIADSANELADRIEQSLGQQHGGSPQVYAAICAVVLFLGSKFVYIVFRWWAIFGSSAKRDYRPLPKDPQQLGPQVVVGSLSHRKLELLRGSNYGPIVRDYLRSLFERRGLPAGDADPKLPKIEHDLRKPEFIVESIRTMWAELHSKKPICYARWKQLEPMLAALQSSADDDRWRLVRGPDRGSA